MTVTFAPRISVIIPVYNGSNYMQQAIDSALSQTYKNREVIVINDGSTDSGKTSEIAMTYGEKIRYFEKANGGVASALNYGIRNMTGDYLSWLSHDDVYWPVKLERQIDFLRQRNNKHVVLYGDFELIDRNSHPIGICRLEQKITGEPLRAILSASIHGCSTLITRMAFERAGLFNESLKTTQDNEMWLRIYDEGFDFLHIPEVLIKSRIHAEQGQLTMSDINKREATQFYAWALDAFHKKIVQDEHLIFQALADKGINLPFRLLRRSGVNSGKFKWERIFAYKVRLYSGVMIRKFRRFLCAAE